MGLSFLQSSKLKNLAKDCMHGRRRIIVIRKEYLKQLVNQKSKVAKHMAKDKTSNAISAAGEVIRLERLMDAFDMFSSYLTQLEQNVEMLKHVELPHADLLPAVNTIMFASEPLKRELRELPEIAKDLQSKFGSALCKLYRNKAFPTLVTQEENATQFQVHPIVISALSKEPVKPEIILVKLQQIAAENKITVNNWDKFVKELKIDTANANKTQIQEHRRPVSEDNIQSALDSASLEPSLPVPSPRRSMQTSAAVPTKSLHSSSLSEENLGRWAKTHADSAAAQRARDGSGAHQQQQQASDQAGYETLADGWAPMIKPPKTGHDPDFSQKLNAVGKHLAAKQQRPNGVYVYVPS